MRWFVISMLCAFAAGFGQTAERSFDGEWRFDEGLTRKFGFSDEAWAATGNQQFITAIKQVSLTIGDSKVSVTVGPNTEIDGVKVAGGGSRGKIAQ